MRPFAGTILLCALLAGCGGGSNSAAATGDPDAEEPTTDPPRDPDAEEPTTDPPRDPDAEEPTTDPPREPNANDPFGPEVVGRGKDDVLLLDLAKGDLTVTIPEGTYVLSPNAAVPIRGDLVAYNQSGADVFAVFGENPAGGTAWARYVEVESNFASGAARSGETELPTTGDATFTGGYLAVYKVGSGGGYGHITGTSVFFVDFAEPSVRGAITSRQNTGGTPLTDVTIIQTAIENGRFSAETTGGRFEFANNSTRGKVDGLFVGDNGQGIVAATEMYHSAIRGYEVGAISANRQ
jgi:hypothetical protein